MRSKTRRVLFSLLFILILVAGAAYGALRYLPDRLNPWAPVHLDESPNFLTRVKLSRLRENPALCLDALTQAGVRFEPAPDKVTGRGCGLKNAVLIEGLQADVGRQFLLTCPTAVSLVMWEEHVLQPSAEAVFAEPVIRIEHFGSYACRNIYHRANGPRSTHATAEAIDIAAFVLADGRRIRVLNEWPKDTAESLFLHEIHDGACSIFSAVLGPNYNKAHHDHFHLDSGPYRLCR